MKYFQGFNINSISLQWLTATVVVEYHPHAFARSSVH